MNGPLWAALACAVAGPIIGIPLAKLGSPLNACVVLWAMAVVLAVVGLVA